MGNAGDERGLSLIEIVLAIAIISMAVLTMLGALGAMARTSGLQRTRTQLDVEMRSTVEHVRNAPYVACGSGLTLATYLSGFDSGDSTVRAQVTDIRFWQPIDRARPARQWSRVFGGSVSACPSSGDLGLQEVTLHIEHDDLGPVVTKIIKRS